MYAMFRTKFPRYFLVLRISLALFVLKSSIAVTVFEAENDQMRVSPKIAKLAKYLGQFDSVDVLSSNTTFPFANEGSAELVPSSEKEVDIEEAPFGSLLIEARRRLRLLHDCLTPSDAELKAKLITAYEILILADERLHRKFSCNESFANSKILLDDLISTKKTKSDFVDSAVESNQRSTTDEPIKTSNDSTLGVENRGAVQAEKDTKIASFIRNENGQLVHRQHQSTYNGENGTVLPKLSQEIEGARELNLTGEITTPGGSSSSLTNRGHKNEEDSYPPATLCEQRNSFPERENPVNSTNNNNNHNDGDDNDGGGGAMNGNVTNISTHENLTAIIGRELKQTSPNYDSENSSTASSRVVSEFEGGSEELGETGSGAEITEEFIIGLKIIQADPNGENIFRKEKQNHSETGEDLVVVSNSVTELRSNQEVREFDQQRFSPYYGTTMESRLVDTTTEKNGTENYPKVNNSLVEESVGAIFESSSDRIFEDSTSGNIISYDSVIPGTTWGNDGSNFEMSTPTSEEIEPDERNLIKIETTIPAMESVSDGLLLKSGEESVHSKETKSAEEVNPLIPETKNCFAKTQTSISTEEASKSSAGLSTREGESSTIGYQENSIEEFAVASESQKNTVRSEGRTIQTPTDTEEKNRRYFTTLIPAVTESGDEIYPETKNAKNLGSDSSLGVPRPTELTISSGDRKSEAGVILVSRRPLHRIMNTHFQSDPIDLAPVQNPSSSYRHYEMDNSVGGSVEFTGRKSTENDPRTVEDRGGQDAVDSKKSTPLVFAPFHPLLAGKKLTRNHKPTTTWGKPFSKREGQNTDLENVFRWFYGLGENTRDKTVGTMEEPEVLQMPRSAAKLSENVQNQAGVSISITSSRAARKNEKKKKKNEEKE